MRRRVFDILVSTGGAVVVVLLLLAGALAMWGYTFAKSNVHDQLAQQQITFPAKDSKDLADPKIGPYLSKYAGQQLTTGEQAKAYADHYIAVHLSEMPYDGVYSQVSAASRANPNDAALATEVQTTFRGTTLRGMLLEAYAFSTFGQIALWSAIAAFSAAAVLAILVALGLWHAIHTAEDAELLGRHGAATSKRATAPPSGSGLSEPLA